MIKSDIMSIEKRIQKQESGKGKDMFTVICRSYIYQESFRKASLDRKQPGFAFICSDKIRLVQKTVIKDAELPG